MDIDSLLSDIYRLLLQQKTSAATDLLTEFVLEKEREGIRFRGGVFAGLSDAPLKIVSQLRTIFADHGLSPQLPAINRHSYFHELDDEDLELIDIVSAEMTAKAKVYLYDEEEVTLGSETIFLSPSEVSAPETAPIGLTICPDFAESDADEEREGESEEEWDSEVRQLSTPDSFDESESEGGLEDDTDEVLEGQSCDAADFEFLDDFFLDGSGPGTTLGTDDYQDEDFFGDEDPRSETEFGGRGDLVDVDDTTISKEERARQVAVRVGLAYGWGREGIDLLAEIFEEHYWGQARLAIEQMLEEGITIDELRLVKELKDLWEGDEAFSLGFLRAKRSDYCTYLGGRVLSWRMAARVARLFPNGDICEVESFLLRAFDAWYEGGTSILRRHPVFLNYLKHILRSIEPERWCPEATFYDPFVAENFDCEVEKDMVRTPLYKELVHFGLIPPNRSDFLADVGKPKRNFRERIEE